MRDDEARRLADKTWGWGFAELTYGGVYEVGSVYVEEYLDGDMDHTVRTVKGAGMTWEEAFDSAICDMDGG